MTEAENKIVPSVPVGDIRFNYDGKSYSFSPTDDISAKEVCLILQMILNVMANRSSSIDIGSFINQNNLGKHFTEIPDEQIEKESE